MTASSNPTGPLLVCASTQYWDEAWFRKQHFMHRLSRRRRVLYVEPSFSILRRPSSHCPPGQENRPWSAVVQRRDEGLWTWRPARGLPFWTHPAVSRMQYRAWGGRLRRAARSLTQDPVPRTWLWMYNPLWIQATETLRPERIIFDMVDDLAAYDARAHSRRNMRRCVEEALERADLVFTTSARLAEMYASRTKTGRMEIVPNGVRGEWVDRPRGPVPEEILDLPQPWIGFMGAVFSYLDYEILHAVAAAFPKASLIFVGPVHEEAQAASLRAQGNAHFLGRRPQERIPDYIGAFDVCLSPFRAGPIRRAVNPLKVYEYLALGRKVVSTPLESLLGEPVAEWIRFADGPDAFVAAVHEALEEDGGETAERARREAVRPYAWETLAARVESVLDSAEREWSGTRAAAGHA